MKVIELTNQWKLHEMPLNVGAEALEEVLSMESGWIECNLPCDVRMPLIEHQIIHDPVLADYSYSCEWTAERSWWFVKAIMSEDLKMSAKRIELCIDSIDAHGDIFLNGKKIGEQNNTFYPFRKDIKDDLKEGCNILCIRVTTGLELVSDEQVEMLHNAVCTEATNGCPDRGDLRRTHVRRPQYNVGWDWCPKATSCGVVKNARIVCFDENTIRDVNVSTTKAARDAKLVVSVEIERIDCLTTADADVKVEILLNGRICAAEEKNDILLVSGINFVGFEMHLQNAELWWPAGYGDQPLYDIQVSLRTSCGEEQYPVIRYGIRSVRLDTSRVDETHRKFELLVNDVPIFCKGGNWIPADPIYARITDQNRKDLLQEALNANFNMLRVWGGGYYETDAFYTYCDEMGIMIWQDYMFACGAFPDHVESFQLEVAKEADFQTKRLRNHPSVCLWCGNNEVHSYLNAIEIHKQYPGKQYGLYLSNDLLKRITEMNCSQAPYWNGSPYGGNNPDFENIGDVHYWGQCMMNPDMEKRIEPREYDKVHAAFVSEYGYVGPCTMETICRYFDGKPVDRESRIWDLHNNTFEKKTVIAGISKHYQTDLHPKDLAAYLLHAGLVQSLMLGYSLEAIRRKANCSGALFWMFNDAWGEVGWSIIDYYHRRKPAFYGVKRAFSQKKLIIRREENRLIVFGCNDAPKPLNTEIMVGTVALSGESKDLKTYTVEIPAQSRKELLKLPMPVYDVQNEIVVAIPKNKEIEAERLYDNEVGKMCFSDCNAKFNLRRGKGQEYVLQICADGFMHGVRIENVCNPSDDYFELLPDVNKTVVFSTDEKEISIRAVYPNRQFVLKME